MVGRTPWSAADAHVGLLGLKVADFTGEERVQGDPRRPGGLPHDCIWIPAKYCRRLSIILLEF